MPVCPDCGARYSSSRPACPRCFLAGKLEQAEAPAAPPAPSRACVPLHLLFAVTLALLLAFLLARSPEAYGSSLPIALVLGAGVALEATVALAIWKRPVEARGLALLRAVAYGPLALGLAMRILLGGGSLYDAARVTILIAGHALATWTLYAGKHTGPFYVGAAVLTWLVAVPTTLAVLG